MGEARKKLEEKKALFDANPNRFIDENDIVLGVIRRTDANGTPGIAYMHSTKVSNAMLKTIGFDIPQFIQAIIGQREIEAQQAQRNRIIKPGDNGELIK